MKAASTTTSSMPAARAWKILVKLPDRSALAPPNKGPIIAAVVIRFSVP